MSNKVTAVPSYRLRAAVVCTAGFLVHLTLGTLYTFGNMSPYIVSYLRQHGTPDLTETSSTWIYALMLAGQGGSMWIGGFLEKKLGTRLTTLLGSWIMSAGVLLTYFSLISFWFTLATYGLLFGIGVGIAYAPPMACAMKWLPDRKGLAGGVVVAGFGAGAFIFDQVQTAFINPDDLHAIAENSHNKEKYFHDHGLLHRTRLCFLLLGGIYAVIQLIGCMFLVDPKDDLAADTQQQPLVNEDSNGVMAKKESLTKPTDRHSGLRPLQLLRQVSFYVLWFMFLCNGLAVIFTATLFKSFGLTFINDDHFLAVVAAVSAPFNAASRIIWGYAADYFTFRIAMISMTSMMTALLLSFAATTLGGRVMFFFWVCLLFFCVGGNFALFPVATARFGKTYFSANYGLLFTSQVVAGPLGALLSSSLSDAIGWTGMWFLGASLSFLGTTLAFFYKAPSVSARYQFAH